jgi:histidine triad (HIT) family protein
MAYDRDNIFAKILRGEIPCQKVYEDDHVLAFNDINPKCPVHVLVIPKGAYVSFDDFSANASEAEIAAFTRAVGRIAREQGVADAGYRLIANTNANGGQEVPHYHVHILGGGPVGPMVCR